MEFDLLRYLRVAIPSTPPPVRISTSSSPSSGLAPAERRSRSAPRTRRELFDAHGSSEPDRGTRILRLPLEALAASLSSSMASSPRGGGGGVVAERSNLAQRFDAAARQRLVQGSPLATSGDDMHNTHQQQPQQQQQNRRNGHKGMLRGAMIVNDPPPSFGGAGGGGGLMMCNVCVNMDLCRHRKDLEKSRKRSDEEIGNNVLRAPLMQLGLAHALEQEHRKVDYRTTLLQQAQGDAVRRAQQREEAMEGGATSLPMQEEIPNDHTTTLAAQRARAEYRQSLVNQINTKVAEREHMRQEKEREERAALTHLSPSMRWSLRQLAGFIVEDELRHERVQHGAELRDQMERDRRRRVKQEEETRVWHRQMVDSGQLGGTCMPPRSPDTTSCDGCNRKLPRDKLVKWRTLAPPPPPPPS